MSNNSPIDFSPFHNFKHDLPAGVAVFLVSLPLCLGIALASGAPLLSGMIAGIVGGIVVGLFSSSSLGVSGPAAGLTVLVLNGIEQMGFPTFLLAVIVSGVIQILLSIFKAGIIGYYFPSTVISGMLFGIGAIIILKQIPHAFGYDQDYEGNLDFMQVDGYTTLSELSHTLNLILPTAAIGITVIAITILLIWESPWLKNTKIGTLIPGSLLAVFSGIFINQTLLQLAPEFALAGNHLVSIPIAEQGMNIFSHMTFPDLSQFKNVNVYSMGLIIAVVGSLESLLSVEAADKLDPHKRSTNTNRELFAQGIGNISSGLLGGIPVTQVIIRSSANIQARGRTKSSTIIHGVLLLVSVLIIPQILNMIPLATLAAILIMIGFKLAHPAKVRKMFKAGMFHFVPFICTAGGLIFTDLLTGVAIGSAIAIFSILLENYRMGMYYQTTKKGNVTILHLAEHISFLNKANILRALHRQPANTELIVNALNTKYIDFDVKEIFDNFAIEAQDKKIDYKFIDSNIAHPTRSKSIQDNMSPDEALDLLKEGNRRFVHNLQSHQDLLAQVNITSSGQYPFAIILSCIDSRTSTELIFDQGLGDIFSARIAGNIINKDILGSMEYACSIAGSKLIMVLGHSQCGAISGACANVKLENMTGLLDKIKPAVERVHQHCSDLHGSELVDKVAKENVYQTMQQIIQYSDTLNKLHKSGKINIVGGMYNIDSGEVEFCE